MVRRDVEELVVVVRIIAPADEPQIPAGEHAGGSVDVLLGVVADTEREQLHDLATEVLLRTLTRVDATVEPHEHRRIFRHLDQELSEAAERQLAECFELTLRAGELPTLAIIFVPCTAPKVPAILL